MVAGEPPLLELDMEKVMEEMEVQCHSKMNEAVRSIEGLGIEYDENVVCDICRSVGDNQSKTIWGFLSSFLLSFVISVLSPYSNTI